jgi:hypothetical protein
MQITRLADYAVLQSELITRLKGTIFGDLLVSTN